MRYWIKISAVLLCLLLLAGCNNESADAAGDTAPGISLSMTLAEQKQLYATAKASVNNGSDLKLTTEFSQTRTVGGETYSEKSTGTAIYCNPGTDAMVSQIRETLTFGSYNTDYYQHFLGGTAYCAVNDYGFQTAMSAADYLALQLPAALLDSALYQTGTAQKVGEQTVITFSAPTALEKWVCDSQYIQLISASGTAVINSDGTLSRTAYQAQYSLGDTVYSLAVTVGVTISSDIPLESEPQTKETTSIAYFEAPKVLLQVVGDVYTSQSLSTSLTEVISCQAASMVRQQSADVHTWGSGNDFMAKADYTVNVTDYTSTTSTTIQTETFRNGTFYSSTNGNPEIEIPAVTAAHMRAYCEDTALTALITTAFLKDAKIEDLGDFYYITFTGNDAFAEAIFAQVYALISLDLDVYAPDYTTNNAEGYLTVNKYTGLPTAAGLSFKRTHTIDTVAYQTTYQLDQALTLSSTTAYESITGDPEPESEPAEKAAPLLYKVTGENGQIMWLLGTIHIGDARTGYLPQALYDAFDSADALAVEFDVLAFEEQVASDPELIRKLYPIYYYTDGSTIDQHLSDTLYTQANKLLLASGSNSINAPYLKAAGWESILDAFLMEQSTSLTSDKGVDVRLLSRAKSQNKPVWNIEDGLSQAKMYSDFSEALQAYMLQQVVETPMLEHGKAAQELFDLWCQGDEAALSQALQDDLTDFTEEELKLYEEYQKAISTDRNIHMLNVAKEYLESGKTVFYAVGLAHLLSEDGLVNSLRNAGYTVEIVTYN